MKFEVYKLKDVCEYVTERISIDKVTLKNYISTENLLPEKGGKTTASGLPKAKTVVSYQKGDTLISNIRPYFKKIWLSNTEGGSSGDVLVFRSNSKVDEVYLYYFLSQNKIFDYMVQTSKGTKMPRGDKEALMKYSINVPVLEYQKRVADMLSSIDKKIELNNSIISNLKDIAQTLFKHWFVDFEFPNENGNPYKSSGGKMVESELGMIPEGWKVNKLEEQTKIVRGGSPRPIKDFIQDSGIPWVKISDANASQTMYLQKTKEYIKAEGKTKSREVYPGMLILSNSATPGIPMFMNIYACVHDGWLIFDAYKDISKEFTYLFLLSERERILTLSNGSVFRNLKTSILKTYPIAVPGKKILSVFQEKIEEINGLILSTDKQNITLMELRDTLLPKLLSGEIELSEKMEVADNVSVS